MSLWRPVLNASAMLVAGRALSLLAALISIAAISRSLGPTEFGQLSYVLALVAIVAPLGQFGLNAIVVKDLVNSPEERNEILGATLAVRIGATVLSLVIALAVIAMLRPGDGFFLWAVLILMLAEMVRATAVCSFAFEAQKSFGLIALVNAAIAIAFAALKTYLALQGAELGWFVAAFAGEVAVSGPVFYLLYRIKLSNAPFTASVARIRDLTGRSGYLAISGVLAIANLKIDQVMLGNMAGDVATGVYAAAARLSEFWFFVPGLIATAVFPSLIKLYDKDRSAFAKMFQNGLDVLAFTAFVFILAVSFFAAPIVLLVFGPGFADASLILVIHMWGGLFFAMRALASKWLVLKDLYWFSLLSHGLGAGGNVVLNLFLIPEHGAIGAAIATVVSYGLAGYLVFFLIPETRPLALAMTRALFVPFRLPKIALQLFVHRSEARVGTEQ